MKNRRKDWKRRKIFWFFTPKKRIFKQKIYHENKQLFFIPQNRKKKILKKRGFLRIVQHIKREAKKIPFSKKIIKYIFISGGILWIFLGIYTILFSSYFIIKTDSVYIETTDETSDIFLAYRALESEKDPIYIFSSPKYIKKQIQSFQKNISHIEITKEFPRSLHISLSSYPLIFSTKIWENIYNITENGILIPEKKWEKDIDLIPIDFIDMNNFQEYDTFISPNELKYIYAIKDFIHPLTIHKIQIYYKEQEIHIFMQENVRIIFDITQPIEDQILRLDYFLKKKSLTLNNPDFIYVDLRVPYKIFSCPKTEEYYCNINIRNIWKR